MIFSTLLMIYRGGPYSLLDSLHLALQLHTPFNTLGGLLYKDLISFLDHVLQWTTSFDLQQVCFLLQLFSERFYSFCGSSQKCKNLQNNRLIILKRAKQTHFRPLSQSWLPSQETKTTVNIYQHVYPDAIK